MVWMKPCRCRCYCSRCKTCPRLVTPSGQRRTCPAILTPLQAPSHNLLRLSLTPPPRSTSSTRTHCSSFSTISKVRISSIWRRASSRSSRGVITRSISHGSSGTRSLSSPRTTTSKAHMCTSTTKRAGVNASSPSSLSSMGTWRMNCSCRHEPGVFMPRVLFLDMLACRCPRYTHALPFLWSFMQTRRGRSERALMVCVRACVPPFRSRFLAGNPGAGSIVVSAPFVRSSIVSCPRIFLWPCGVWNDFGADGV
mmetsp:Transcript_118866/g.165631  ORF Transcript_118866/g.165631 Transcript_118866/m.165631 type:complete len:253 (-) Transcript_118866:7-765(-)